MLERSLVVCRSLFPQRIPQIIVRLRKPGIFFDGLLKFRLCFWESLCQHQFNALIVDRDRGITILRRGCFALLAPTAGKAASTITATKPMQRFAARTAESGKMLFIRSLLIKRVFCC